MHDARQLLEQQFLEMRWRCLSLAADLDRIERSPGGRDLVARDERIALLRKALDLLQQPGVNRAEKVQMLFSDMTPPPAR